MTAVLEQQTRRPRRRCGARPGSARCSPPPPPPGWPTRRPASPWCCWSWTAPAPPRWPARSSARWPCRPWSPARCSAPGSTAPPTAAAVFVANQLLLLGVLLALLAVTGTRPVVRRGAARPAGRRHRARAHRRLHRADPAAGAGAAPAPGVRRGGHQLQPRRRRRARARRRPGRRRLPRRRRRRRPRRCRPSPSRRCCACRCRRRPTGATGGLVRLGRRAGCGCSPPSRRCARSRVATTLSFTGMGALPVVFPLLAEEVGQPAAAGGALFSAFALGALVGSLAVASRAPRTGPMRHGLRRDRRPGAGLRRGRRRADPAGRAGAGGGRRRARGPGARQHADGAQHAHARPTCRRRS